MADRDYEIGYGRPPKHSRFRKGQSDNPKGRPKKSKNIAKLVERELAEEISVTERGKSRRMSKREAIIKRLVNDSMLGKLNSQKLLLGLMQGAETADVASPSRPDGLDEADLQMIEAFSRELQEAEQLEPEEEQDPQLQQVANDGDPRRRRVPPSSKGG